MSDFLRTVLFSAFANTAPTPTVDQGAVDFLEFFSSKGIDINHSFFRDFRLDDRASLVQLRQRLVSAAGSKKTDEIIVAYLEKYLELNGFSWSNLPGMERIANVLLAGPKESTLWYAGFYIQQRIYAFYEKNRASCSAHLRDCDELYKKLIKEKKIAEDISLVEKVPARLRDRGIGYTVNAIFRRSKMYAIEKACPHFLCPPGEAGVDSRYRSQRIEFAPVAGALPGFSIFEVKLGGDREGTMIIGSPSEGARVNLKIDIGGRVGTQPLEEEYGSKLQYHGTVTMQSTEDVPLGVVVVEGKQHVTRFDARRQDGLVIVLPNGSLHIADKRLFTLSDITGKAQDDTISLSLTSGSVSTQIQFYEAAQRSKASIISATSFDPSGRFEKWRKGNGDSTSRFLFTFKDGTFGMFDTPNGNSNEALTILYRLENELGHPLQAIAKCDRGSFDTAAYYLNGKRKVDLSSNGGEPSNRIIFYSDPK